MPNLYLPLTVRPALTLLSKGKTYRQAAAELNIPLGTLSMRVRRARLRNGLATVEDLLTRARMEGKA